MENQAQNPNSEVPKDPKPNDQVQLDVETVTPDTEKQVENTTGDAKEEVPSERDQEKEQGDTE